MGFRENLQHLRSTRDMSQADLAQQLGVSRQSMAKWEAEKSYPEMGSNAGVLVAPTEEC